MLSHLSAVEYVRDHFTTYDYGFQPIITGVGYANDGNAIEVTFEGGVMTVWVEDCGSGAFLYGEW